MSTKTKFLKNLKQILQLEEILADKKKCFEEIIMKIESLDEISADKLINHLELKPIFTEEDGYFKEFVRTEKQTEIFYLLKGKQICYLHALDTTETWNWLAGNNISLYIDTKQEFKEIILNADNPSFTIEKGVFFGAKLANPKDNDFGLVTCRCEPGFELKYYIHPSSELITNLHKCYGNEELINELKPKISGENISESTSKENQPIWQSMIQLFYCCRKDKSNNPEQTPLNPSQTNS